MNGISPAHSPTGGYVYLIGAGPSDPALLTMRAHELLLSCDVIAYDALIAPLLLTYAGHGAELINVGYRGQDGKQSYGIHPIVIERALAGKRVARIKSGDPAIYSRLAQEIEDLQAHNIPYEVISGISSANAASSYFGIPLTHRDLASDVVFASGHDLHRPQEMQQSNWPAICSMHGTLVIYMGTARLKENCQKLIALGKDGQTPCALITEIGSFRQRCLHSTLKRLPDDVAHADVAKVPGLIVIGKVVELRERLAWLAQAKPLFGLAIMFASSAHPSAHLLTKLRDLGASVYSIPHVKHEDLPFQLPRGFSEKYAGLAFADSHSVIAFMGALRRAQCDIRGLYPMRLLAFTKGAQDALLNFALRSELCSPDTTSLLSPSERCSNVMVFCSQLDENYYRQRVSALGVSEEVTALYRHNFHFDLEPDENLIHVALIDDDEAMALIGSHPCWQKLVQKIPVITKKSREIDGPNTVHGTHIWNDDETLTTFLLTHKETLITGGKCHE